MRNFYYDIEDVSQELRDLLETKVFRFVLTTTYDAYLETLMFDTYGVIIVISSLSIVPFSLYHVLSIVTIFDHKSILSHICTATPAPFWLMFA